ncbi:MAG: DUF255 domain-containing protein [Pseudomonadota bacterium]
MGAAFSAAEQRAHQEAYAARRAAEGDGYDARTARRDASGAPKFLNRLILEPSPYLRQHAHNPVDWRPWGPAALAEAEASGRPIFLSVGYATCHWCHVMEAESFDQEDVAAALNRDFIPIKVDREELPGVDETYMLATMLMTGRGGWPNSVWMTPAGEPFYAAMYLPKAEFERALIALAETWATQRDAVDATAAQLSQTMRAYAAHRDAAAEITPEIHVAAQAAVAEKYNEAHGGFGVTHQFPLEVYLQFLLDRWSRNGDEDARRMALNSLDAILAGAVHDHAGGGFHRYAVDPGWSVPHFEKMLYNQGEMVRTLTAAWEISGAARYRRGAERAIAYALRDMRAEGGGFYAAEDADSIDPATGEKAEGAFYLWRRDAFRAALTADGVDVDAASAALGLDWGPKLEAGHPLAMETDALNTAPGLDGALEALRRARTERPRPLRDEKIIAGWNGLMIRALADAAAAYRRPDYAAAASEAAEAIWRKLWRGDRLMRFATDAQAAEGRPGAVEDYAWFGLGLLALHDYLGPNHGDAARWKSRADQVARAMLARFQDGDGRLKMTEADGPLGPIYQQDDSATPSGESSALEFLALLAKRDRGVEFQLAAERLLAALSGGVAARPGERLTALQAAAILHRGEARPRRPLSNGVATVSARRDGASLILDLRVAEGWHVNAHRPLQADLIGTALRGEDLASVAYPEATQISLGFSDTPLAVLKGDAAIVAALTPSSEGRPIRAELTLQACSDQECLAPVTAAFRVGEPPAVAAAEPPRK